MYIYRSSRGKHKRLSFLRSPRKKEKRKKVRDTRLSSIRERTPRDFQRQTRLYSARCRRYNPARRDIRNCKWWGGIYMSRAKIKEIDVGWCGEIISCGCLRLCTNLLFNWQTMRSLLYTSVYTGMCVRRAIMLLLAVAMKLFPYIDWCNLGENKRIRSNSHEFFHWFFFISNTATRKRCIDTHILPLRWKYIYRRLDRV